MPEFRGYFMLFVYYSFLSGIKTGLGLSGIRKNKDLKTGRIILIITF
jgi:hypothetical protein